MFLQPDDYVVLQDSNSHAVWWNPEMRDITVDEIKKFRDCGVNTMFQAAFWSSVEKNGEYDWTIMDNAINAARAGGMKIIITTPISPAQDLDADLYCSGRDGEPYRGHLSMWNEDARELTAKFISDLLARYGGPDINFMMGGLIVEHYLWNAPIYLDRAARNAWASMYPGEDMDDHASGIATVTEELRQFLLEGVIDYYMFMQKMFIKQHNEIWDHTQYLIALQSEHNAGFIRPHLYRTYRESFPDASLMMMSSTYWAHGVGNAQRINDILKRYNVRILCEASYTGGLRDQATAERAIAGGLCEHSAVPEQWQGTVVSPFNSFGDEDGFETIPQWKYDIIRDTVEKWRVAKCS